MSATQDLSAVLTPEDVEFLTALANELKTQDTAGTARPVIYQIMERKKDPCIDPAYADGMVLALGEDGEEFFDEDVAGARAWLLEGFEWTPEELATIDAASSLENLADFCEEHGVPYHFTGYRDIETFQGFFLTLHALRQHVERNDYHYKHPVSYAQAAGWRNPELKRLLAIVEKFATETS